MPVLKTIYLALPTLKVHATGQVTITNNKDLSTNDLSTYLTLPTLKVDTVTGVVAVVYKTVKSEPTFDTANQKKTATKTSTRTFPEVDHFKIPTLSLIPAIADGLIMLEKQGRFKIPKQSPKKARLKKTDYQKWLEKILGNVINLNEVLSTIGSELTKQGVSIQLCLSHGPCVYKTSEAVILLNFVYPEDVEDEDAIKSQAKKDAQQRKQKGKLLLPTLMGPIGFRNQDWTKFKEHKGWVVDKNSKLYKIDELAEKLTPTPKTFNKLDERHRAVHRGYILRVLDIALDQTHPRAVINKLSVKLITPDIEIPKLIEAYNTTLKKYHLLRKNLKNPKNPLKRTGPAIAILQRQKLANNVSEYEIQLQKILADVSKLVFDKCLDDNIPLNKNKQTSTVPWIYIPPEDKQKTLFGERVCMYKKDRCIPSGKVTPYFKEIQECTRLNGFVESKARQYDHKNKGALMNVDVNSNNKAGGSYTRKAYLEKYYSNSNSWMLKFLNSEGKNVVDELVQFPENSIRIAGS